MKKKESANHAFSEKARVVFRKIGSVLRVIASWIVRLRKGILAVPVLVGTALLAQYNYAHLPARVGIGLQLSGEFLQTVSRDAAVLCPVAVTLLCLVFMFCSRKTVYPWLISLFSLALPVLVLLTNIYPA